MAELLGADVKGQALIDALINALAAIQTTAVGTAAGTRATQIGDVLTVDIHKPSHRAEVRQTAGTTLEIHLEALP